MTCKMQTCAAHTCYKVICPSKFPAGARVVHLLAAALMSRAAAAGSNHHLRCACVCMCVHVCVCVCVLFLFLLRYISASMENQLVRCAT